MNKESAYTHFLFYEEEDMGALCCLNERLEKMVKHIRNPYSF
jgi:hypothetical protein